MADQMNPGVVNDPKHNVGARNSVINSWVDERLKKERAIEVAIEKHVKPLKEELSKLDSNVKKDTGMGLKYLKGIYYKPLKLQQDAKDFLDEDECDKVLDHMRGIFEAMKAGGQLDFVDAIESTASSDDFDEPSDAVLGKAFKAGRTAGEKGEDGTANPYNEDDPCHKKWMEGWTEAQSERAKAMGGNTKETEAA